MGLNAKEIPVCLLRMIQVSIEASFTFIRRHPLISGVLLILCILYLFLSYIYHFLVYLSPFLVCTAIFVRIFWSSEEGQLNYIRGNEKKGEQRKIEKQLSKLPSYGKRDMLLERRYSLRNATSRRRNFKDKKWDAQDIVVEEKDKELSTVESNDSENKDAKSSEKEESSSDYAERFQNPHTQISPLKPEPLISDQVKISDSDQQYNKSDGFSGGSALENEDTAEGDEEEEEEEEEGDESQDEEESQEETNRAVEWTKDDQKNLMDLGISEIERNRRLESLIARRRARQHLKLQIEKGLIDIRTVSPTQVGPLLIARTNPFDSPKNYGGIDGLEIPGSAPSVLRPSRNPFDLPYDASEEKPNLTGDSFQQEFTTNHQKDMPFCRHESFSLGPSLPLDEESYPFFINGRKISDRFRRFPDKGNHDLIIEKLFSKNCDFGIGFSTGVQAPKPLIFKGETTNQEDTKRKTDIIDTKGKKVENAQVTKSISDHKSESDFMESSNRGFAETDYKISKYEKSGVSEKPEESRTHDKPGEKFLNFPIASSTAICESPFDSFSSPTSKNQENMYFPERCIFHGPTCSIASDLQVEFSEIGSPTLTTDGESAVYDGDMDKEAVITPGSEDLGGVSFNSRVSEEDIAEVSNNSPKGNIVPLQETIEDEDEDGAFVNSLSSTSDLRGDTPTHAKINYDYNIFGNMKKAEVDTQAIEPSNSSNFVIGRSVDHPSHETQSEEPEGRQNLSENSRTEAQIVDHHVNDSAATNTQNSNSTEDPGPSIVHRESTDAVSLNSSSSLSPRSVLPEKTLTDQVSSSAFNQQIRTDVPPSNIEAMAQSTSTDELPSNTMPPIMQPLLIDPITQIHNGAPSNFQEISCLSAVADDSNTTDKSGKPIFDDEDRKENNTLIISRNKEPADPPENSIGNAKSSGKENDAGQEKLKNGESSEDKSTSVFRQDDSITSPTSAQMKAIEEINNKSEKVVDSEVTSSPSKVTEKSGISTATEYGKMAVELTQLADVNPPKPDRPTCSSEKVSNVHSESKKNDDKEEIKEKLKNDTPPQPSKPNGSSDEVSNVHNESKKNDAEIKEKLKNDTPTKPDKPNDSSEEVSTVQSESKKNDTEISNKEEIKEQLNNGTPTKPDKPDDSLEKVRDVQSESKKNDAEISNKEDIKEKLENDIPSKLNDSSEKVSNVHKEPKEVEDDMEKDKLTSGNIAKVNEVTRSSFAEDTEGKSTEANKIEAIEQESNKKEAMALFRSAGTSEDSITTNTKEPGEAVHFEK